MPVTSSGIAYDCLSPHGGVPVLFLHAGVADRRMWDPQWEALAATWDMARLDLRGFGSSECAPEGPVSEVADVVATMEETGGAGSTWSGLPWGRGSRSRWH